MKKLFFLLALFTLGITAGFSQTDKEDLDIIRAVFSKEKKALVQDYMDLQGTQADAFWAVYDQYETKRKELSSERFKIISDYANSYGQLTDEQADALAKRTLSNEGSFISLQKSYLKKFSKAVGGKNAAKFLQLDNYLHVVIRKEIMEGIPFIDELD